jgi:hypothetical protein
MSADRPVSNMDILMIHQLVAEGALPPEEGDKLIARIEELISRSQGAPHQSSPAPLPETPARS